MERFHTGPGLAMRSGLLFIWKSGGNASSFCIAELCSADLALACSTLFLPLSLWRGGSQPLPSFDGFSHSVSHHSPVALLRARMESLDVYTGVLSAPKPPCSRKGMCHKRDEHND
ncbi:hypothetical protein J6590_104953 [Homalodisca vitripennis]|nr:hypothetical protein J6590_104953 [Homalodisca vitripennis]